MKNYENLVDEHLEFMIRLACDAQEDAEIDKLIAESQLEHTPEEKEITRNAYLLFQHKLAEQEPLARRAAELVGKRAGQYETRFGESSKLDVQDLVSMAAWDIAYDFLKLQSTHDADLMARELERIDTELESYMQHAGTSPEDD